MRTRVQDLQSQPPDLPRKPYDKASRVEPQARLNVAQALPVCQLGERHCSELFDTWKGSYVVVATVTRDEPRERAPGQAIHQLREYRLAAYMGGPSRKRVPEADANFKSTPPEIAENPLCIKCFVTI